MTLNREEGEASIKRDGTTESRRVRRAMNAEASKKLMDHVNAEIEASTKLAVDAFTREFICKIVEGFNMQPVHEKALWEMANDCAGENVPLDRIPLCIYTKTRNGRCKAYPAPGKFCCKSHAAHEPQASYDIFANMRVRENPAGPREDDARYGINF